MRRVLMALALCGCDGVLLAPAEGDRRVLPIANCDDASVTTTAEQPLLRLNAQQYRESVRALFGGALGDTLAAASTFPEPQIDAGFTTDADANVTNTTVANAIEDNAEQLADLVLANADTRIPQLMGSCVPSAPSDAAIDGCIDTFITRIVPRAYRRAATTQELALVRRVYDQLRPTQGARVAVAAVMQTILQAPAFLYRIERSAPGALSGRERAVRLGYLFWSALPDDALVSAAEDGTLDTREGVELHARRLVLDPRSRVRVGQVHRDWMQVYKLSTAAKDPNVFPEFDAALRASALEEPGRFVDEVITHGDGKLRTLLTSSAIPVDARLAQHYGVSGTGVVTVPQRFGLLTLASTMIAQGGAANSAPIHRGAFIRRQLLCSPPPAVPGNVSIAEFNASVSHLPTARERMQPLTQREQCAGCHTHINPFGLALEQYDGVGKLRTTENGAAIDTSGSLALGDLQGDFANTAELTAMLGESSTVRACYATQWFRAAFGRTETAVDRCDLQRVVKRFEDSDGDIRELMIALTQTNAFLYRSEP